MTAKAAVRGKTRTRATPRRLMPARLKARLARLMPRDPAGHEVRLAPARPLRRERLAALADCVPVQPPSTRRPSARR